MATPKQIKTEPTDVVEENPQRFYHMPTIESPSPSPPPPPPPPPPSSSSGNSLTYTSAMVWLPVSNQEVSGKFQKAPAQSKLASEQIKVEPSENEEEPSAANDFRIRPGSVNLPTQPNSAMVWLPFLNEQMDRETARLLTQIKIEPPDVQEDQYKGTPSRTYSGIYQTYSDFQPSSPIDYTETAAKLLGQQSGPVRSTHTEKKPSPTDVNPLWKTNETCLPSTSTQLDAPLPKVRRTDTDKITSITSPIPPDHNDSEEEEITSPTWVEPPAPTTFMADLPINVYRNVPHKRPTTPSTPVPTTFMADLPINVYRNLPHKRPTTPSILVKLNKINPKPADVGTLYAKPIPIRPRGRQLVRDLFPIEKTSSRSNSPTLVHSDCTWKRPERSPVRLLSPPPPVLSRFSSPAKPIGYGVVWVPICKPNVTLFPMETIFQTEIAWIPMYREFGQRNPLIAPDMLDGKELPRDKNLAQIIMKQYTFPWTPTSNGAIAGLPGAGHYTDTAFFNISPLASYHETIARFYANPEDKSTPNDAPAPMTLRNQVSRSVLNSVHMTESTNANPRRNATAISTQYRETRRVATPIPPPIVEPVLVPRHQIPYAPTPMYVCTIKWIYVNLFPGGGHPDTILMYIANKLRKYDPEIECYQLRYSYERETSNFQIKTPLVYFYSLISPTFWPRGTQVCEFLPRSALPQIQMR